jgi:CDP-diacylglycerol--serine O-phosphatidyltransferase
VPKPPWLSALEHRIAGRLSVHPNVLAWAKLLIVAPLMFLALRQIDVLPKSEALVGGLFVVFFVLDYLDGVVARERGLASGFGRVLDRLTDYPLLVVVSWFCLDLLPVWLVLTKLGVDLLLLVLYVLGRGTTENRLRTAMSYATVLGLLLLSQGWAPRIISPRTVEYLLWASIALSSTVVLYNLDLLQKRFIADALSAANLLCGVFSILFASRGRFEVSLLFVLVGAAFDGFDGAAARRWGGTRFGVYSDDVADGVNYGIAPAFALYFALGGWPGAAIGVLYAVFTISRLVFFTLEKSSADPNYFRGVPSPVGGIITMSSIVVFRDHPELIGLMVGIAAAQMTSFSTHYRHLGRALGGWVSRRRRDRGGRSRRRAMFGAPVYVVILLLGVRALGVQGATAIILVGNLVYGFLPTALAFTRALSLLRRVGRAADPQAHDEDAFGEVIEPESWPQAAALGPSQAGDSIEDPDPGPVPAGSAS